jgi:hypothetical protein
MPLTPPILRKPPKPKGPDVEAFIAALPLGQANAVTWPVLAQRLGLGRNADRKLRALSEQAAYMGMLACSTDDGYYLPTSMAEAQASIRRIASQGAVMTRRARLMQQLADAQFLYQDRLL